jgi:hypothetical protein
VHDGVSEVTSDLATGRYIQLQHLVVEAYGASSDRHCIAQELAIGLPGAAVAETYFCGKAQSQRESQKLRGQHYCSSSPCGICRVLAKGIRRMVK